MSAIIVSFPPGAGGNHLRNIISHRDNLDTLLSVYDTKNITAHLSPGNNIKKDDIDIVLLDQLSTHVLHGHFGEIMSFHNEIQKLKDKKFIILSPDSSIDRAMLNLRRQRLGKEYNSIKDNDYFNGEQVFLYEPLMYQYYFQLQLENIMNISISEWFASDITLVVERINRFCNFKIDTIKASTLHNIWIEGNIK